MADEDKRLIAAIGMMGVTSTAGDHEAIAAFRAASAILRTRKLTWNDVATRAFGAPEAQKAEPAPPTRAKGFGDIFDDLVDTAFSTVGFGSTRRGGTGGGRPRRRIGGRSIPEEIVGTVQPRPGGGRDDGEIMTIDVVGEFDTYGPLICFARSVQIDAGVAAACGRQVTVRVRQPAEEGFMPIATAVEIP